jgi:glycyl-tRNA synthetase beta chain
MPEFFLELFSEEIPARLQARGAETLARLIAEALAPLTPGVPALFWGPRRIALAVEVRGEVAARESTERGPRLSAPEAALAGFLRKHNAAREDLVAEGDYWLLHGLIAGQTASELIAAALPGLLWRFPWPKSMRWGVGNSRFTWVRPLRRIVCLLDGEVVRFDLRQGEDDGHGLTSGNETEGHRFMAPGAFAVRGVNEWQKALRERFVIADPAERRSRIAEGIAEVAQAKGLNVVEDDGLLDEVTGLVEWPVALLGAIDARFMDLPPEVRQVSMRVNQRYFALHSAKDHTPAPYFAFVANIAASDGGAAIIAGNERVLRARLADARHFYDLDRRVRLESRVEALKTVTFHARLGTQYDRAKRLEKLAAYIAPLVGADVDLACRAGLLAKVDLTTGMVGEFPELQGVMGYYYALYDGEPREIAEAIRDHYLPKGAGDSVPTAPVPIAVALADKIDQLAGFFAIGERPTGSGDPYALRRAALGVIRIIREHRLRLSLWPLIDSALGSLNLPAVPDEQAQRAYYHVSIGGFIEERLKIQLREEDLRHDIASAAFFAQRADEGRDDLLLLIAKAQALADLLKAEDGTNLLAGYRRAVNIVRIEDKKDGPHAGEPDPSLFTQPEEHALHEALAVASGDIDTALRAEDFAAAMRAMAGLRTPIDAFFNKVTVNDPNPDLRRNRLKLLSRIRDTMNRFADFSLIEG